MSRLLVTGGSSYLGQHLVPLANKSGEVRYTFYRHDPLQLPHAHQLDLREPHAFRDLVGATRPSVIIHLAGSNGEPETMETVICRGTANVVRAAAESGARLIHISTDVVFGGDHAPYREVDPPVPLHAYGRAKAAAERMVQHYPNSVIVRTSLIYGLELMDRGTQWMAASLQMRRPVTLFSDQMRNPIYAPALCRALLELSLTDHTGLLHVAGAQCLSRAEFALRMLDWWGIRERDSLRVGTSDSQRWPRNCCLDISRAQALLKSEFPGVDDVLQTMRNEQSLRDSTD